MTAQAQKMAEQGYITARTAAEKAGVDIATVYRWIDGSKVEGMAVGRNRYVRLDSMIEYLGPEASKALGLKVAKKAG